MATANPHVHENLKAIQKTLSNYDTSFLSDDEEDLCPLCLEALDITDKNFKPCPCGYQICQFCYNNIRQNEELNGRCPACRRKYDDENVEYVILTSEELKMEREKQTRKEWERKQRDKERKENEYANRKHLAGMRVIQKNLVYVVGVNPPVIYEEVANLLKSDKYFGQYGKINKIVVNKKTPHPNNNSDHYHHSHQVGYGVYITFSKKEDAARCIAQVDGTYMDGRLVKAAYGTTKYCSSYLRGLSCPNPNCMFLHEPGEEADSFNRRELTNKPSQQQSSGHTMFYKNTTLNASQTNTATKDMNGLSDSNTSSPAPVKAQLHTENTVNSGTPTPILTPATVKPGANPWGISQAPTPVISLNVSKNTSSNHLPSLSNTLDLSKEIKDTKDVVPNTTTGNSNIPLAAANVAAAPTSGGSSKKKNTNNDKDYIDPYDSLVRAVDFINSRIQFLSEYKPREIKLRSDIIDDETYNRYPSLFSWSNIEASETSDNTLTRKLIDILTVKPAETDNHVMSFLQNVNAALPAVQQQQQQQTPIMQNQKMYQGQVAQPQQMNMNTVPPPGIFGPQKNQLPVRQPPQTHIEQSNPSANSTDFLNQLINGRKVSAST
ncbi:hypothetical protein TPHA_0K00870 [Tetrapisispora phaffii CBS 4417]|uniref:RING-type domain-containing protein n=1 Tax=Tetrapisispora phaffii (strain ATCC 24235 / CBS 4417 / NBRC 1672 / NRRL Y-8282 / UCD 70-5) TaxID=1071381 RepID=G8BZ93_TETPH|nr:hypothetical protein TPHA_0K00870 [Tetrapisispora phaffii CBS 4417]CCE65221.1 hypothetical protein TPHA_0K00870 [Tetrapisispora phaffii CBS 4417]